MEIKEVPIGQKLLPPGKFSPRVEKAANKYLSEKGITLTQLNTKQQQSLLTYIKAKRMMKWLVPLTGVLGLVFIFLSIYWWSFINHFADDFMPDTTVIVLDDGTEKVVELDRELIGGYGRVCCIFGGVLVAVLYSAASSFAGLFSAILHICTTKKILDAFLPLISDSLSTNSKNNIGFGNI